MTLFKVIYGDLMIFTHFNLHKCFKVIHRSMFHILLLIYCILIATCCAVIVQKWSHIPNYLYMFWGGLGHVAVACLFPVLGMKMRIFQEFFTLGNLLGSIKFDIF